MAVSCCMAFCPRAGNLLSRVSFSAERCLQSSRLNCHGVDTCEVIAAELCPSSLQGGQCCLPVGSGDRGAGGPRAGTQVGRGDFPCGRPLWLDGWVCCCTQTPQPTYFHHCKSPFACKVLRLDGFHRRCFQKALLSHDTLAEAAYAGDRDRLRPWALPRRRATESPGSLLSLGCLPGLKKKMWEDSSQANGIQLCVLK